MRKAIAKWWEQLKCGWSDEGHQWRRRHGYDELPVIGTDCTLCGKIY